MAVCCSALAGLQVPVYSRESVSCLLLRWWRWVMVRVSEGGSRRVPVSLACDGTMCACACLNEDVECLPCSVCAVWSRRSCACRLSCVSPVVPMRGG